MAGQRDGAAAEEYFLAGRSLGPAVFLLSLFGTNMTAFTILGSAGHAFANGIVTFRLMASSSAFVIPLTLFFIGTRLWALGKRHGFITPVQMFRDRWECGHIGTAIFAVQAVLLVPYIIIGVMGGGTALRAISGGRFRIWLGGAIVALVVMSYVFFGGMRGTAWVNTFQTVLFLSFGGDRADRHRPRHRRLLRRDGIAARGSRDRAAADARADLAAVLLQLHVHSALDDRVSAHRDLLPHREAARAIQAHRHLLSALHPRDLAAVRLPRRRRQRDEVDTPPIAAKLHARQTLAAAPSTCPPIARRPPPQAAGDDVVLVMLDWFAPVWLAGMLGAGIMAAVMASDSQILALSTMFTEDVFTYYGGTGGSAKRSRCRPAAPSSSS